MSSNLSGVNKLILIMKGTVMAHRAARPIRDAAIYLLNNLVLAKHGWRPFSDDFDLLSDDWPAQKTHIPSASGVYVLMSQQTLFTYPGGSSRVFYIGETRQGLDARLAEHRKFTLQVRCGTAQSRFYPRYEWGASLGAVCAYSEQPRQHGKFDHKAMERALLVEFAEAFRNVPAANSRSAWG